MALPPKRHERRLPTQADVNDLIDWADDLLVDGGGVPTTRTITAGDGLTGGGDLSADRTINLGTPGTITPATTNTASADSHTHAATGFATTEDLHPQVTGGADIDVSVGAVVQRKGTGILLFSGGTTLLGEYAHSEAGLTAALAAMTDGDIVKLPAGSITASVNVPTGGAIKGLGWNSILNGTLTLADGAKAENLKVYQSVNSADDIIGVIGPATGTAFIRDVQVALTQAGAGKALGLLANGGTLRAYECEVWVNGANGSAWGYAAATGGVVEMNQGQVKAWRTV